MRYAPSIGKGSLVLLEFARNMAPSSTIMGSSLPGPDGHKASREAFARTRLNDMYIDLTAGCLRPWMPSDAASLVRHANNHKIWRNLRDRFPHPYTFADAHAWLDAVEGRETDFAIEVAGEAVGGISLVLQQDVARRSAEIGYWLGEAYWNKGIATEAVREMTRYGFRQFDLVRIYACVFERNPASMRVLTKAGFQFEGRHRKAVTKDGETIDELIYAIVIDV